MPRAFKLPDLGEGIHEGEVTAIHVAKGDQITEGDVILEIETDKATVEIPSPFTGKVMEILVKDGDIIPVGKEMIRFDGGQNEAVKSPSEEKSTAAQSIGNRPADASKDHRSQSNYGPIPASPATRRLARELNVDLAIVPAGGPAGLVTAQDVRRFAKQKETSLNLEEKQPLDSLGREAVTYSAGPLIVDVPPLPDFQKYGPLKRLPLRSIRRATAKQMALAWSQIPHVNSQDSIDVTELELFRKKHKEAVAQKGGRLTFTVLALKAALVALKAHPRANASLDVATSEIILKEYYHIGVAVSTDEGLLVPVVKNVDQKSILTLSIELNQLVQRTRDRKVGLDEMRGGSFTITNMGAIGGGGFAPIINYPEVAILGFGQAGWQPVVQEKDNHMRTIVPRLMVPVVLSMDHRVMDGVDGVRFIQTLKQCLEDPGWLMIQMS
jgi:pyruvate dehydrogenase E2 component (dihydrolipoamide acetyltransferase)